MAKNILQLNYDELTTIAKKFKDEGEDTVKLHAATRQRVRDLYKEWIGEAANKFFEEMENELLPALQRLARALFFSQDVVGDIMKLVREADEDTVGLFKDDFSRDDFGASGFESALGGMGGPSGQDDFGAGKFDEALGGVSGGSSSGQDDFGASQFEEALPGQGDQPASGQGVAEQNGQSAQGQAAADSMAGGAGGGSGSGSSGQGMQGDLRGMGVGSSQAQQGVAVGEAGRSGAMADHVYSGSGASGSSSGESQAPAEGGSPGGGGQSSSGGGQAAAAGAAGVAGAAAVGGAAKVVKDQKDKDD